MCSIFTIRDSTEIKICLEVKLWYWKKAKINSERWFHHTEEKNKMKQNCLTNIFFNSNMLYYDISCITGMLNTRQHSLNTFRVNFNKWNTGFSVIWDIGCTDIGNFHNTLTESWICILCFKKREKFKPGCPKDSKTAFKVQHKCTAIVSLNSPVLEFPKMTLWCLSSPQSTKITASLPGFFINSLHDVYAAVSQEWIVSTSACYRSLMTL